jgi:branched-chain amino acid transport system permease protein
MLGAFGAWMLLNYLGVGYWWAVLIVPPIVGLTGIVLERVLIRRLYHLDHLYGLLLTFGLALIIVGFFRQFFGVSGLPYPPPPLLTGGHNLGFMYLPNSRAWVIVASLIVCLVTWFIIEKTRLGAYLRAATENPTMVGAFVFAVVVIGGMGSILGSILTGFGLGLIEGLTRVFYPEGSAVVIFVIMALVLLVKPAGLFGRSA